MLEDAAGDAIDDKENEESEDENTETDESAEEQQSEEDFEQEQSSEEEETDEETAGTTHVVTDQDNLFQIAKRYYGDGSAEYVQRIRDANGISGNNINEGQELVIP